MALKGVISVKRLKAVAKGRVTLASNIKFVKSLLMKKISIPQIQWQTMALKVIISVIVLKRLKAVAKEPRSMCNVKSMVVVVAEMVSNRGITKTLNTKIRRGLISRKNKIINNRDIDLKATKRSSSITRGKNNMMNLNSNSSSKKLLMVNLNKTMGIKVESNNLEDNIKGETRMKVLAGERDSMKILSNTLKIVKGLQRKTMRRDHQKKRRLSGLFWDLRAQSSNNNCKVLRKRQSQRSLRICSNSMQRTTTFDVNEDVNIYAVSKIILLS
jgi:hypothetical protein